MVKILYIITKSDIGGAQKYAADLTKNLDKNIFETKILYGGKDIKWLSNKTYPLLLFFNDWLAVCELIKIYKQEKPNIIHLNSSKTGVLGSLAAAIYETLSSKSYTLNPKIIFTAHGWVFNPTNALSLPIRWFYILLHKIAALFQDKIICVSEYDYNLALSYRIAPKEKLITIHNGINPNMKFLEKQTARKELIKKLPITNYQLPINSIWIGSIGRLVKEKNYETLIKAASFIPNAYFFIIGSGRELENYKSQIVKYKLQNKFFLVEPTGNDAQYLKAFDIFVMSSVKEGLPYILLEAMAAELPIVVTEAGGMPEMIKNHQSGLMVSQKNPEMLAKAVSGLIANKNIADELGKAAKKTVEKNFELNKMAAEAANLYESLVASR